MVEIIEGIITEARQGNREKGRESHLKIDVISSDDKRSSSELDHSSIQGYKLGGYEDVYIRYPEMALGEIYLLTPELLDKLTDKDWQLTTLKKKLGEEQVTALLKEEE